MCFNNGNNSCLWIILIIILFCCCGNFGSDCDRGCDRDRDCGCRDRDDRCC